MRRLIKIAFRAWGYEIRKCIPASHMARPIGVIYSFLEDVRNRGFSPRGIIDVGAHKGDWTRMAHILFPSTPALLIEPQDEMVPFLDLLCREDSNCRFVKSGAGRTEGELVQTIWDDFAGSSFLPKTDPRLLSLGKQRRTRITTIDSILEQDVYADFKPDLVKLDVQGFELEALQGGEALFGRTELFIVETSLYPFMNNQPITREVMAFMAERGYEFYDITECSRRPYDGALGQVDLAFVKKNGRFRETNRWSE